MKFIELYEATKNKYEVYHETYSSAVQEAKDFAEKNGYEINEDDWFMDITAGAGKPSVGETRKHHISLLKNGKEQRKELHIQVYRLGNSRGNDYELNCYIS